MVDFSDFSHPNDEPYFGLSDNGPYCAYCNRPIDEDEPVYFHGDPYHPECIDLMMDIDLILANSPERKENDNDQET